MPVEKKNCPKCGKEMKEQSMFLSYPCNPGKIIKEHLGFKCTSCGHSEN